MELNLEKLINEAVEKRLNELYGKTASFAENDAVVFTPQEAVEFLGGGISYSTLMRECRKKTIPCFHIGNRVYFRRSSLLEWIKAQEEYSLDNSPSMGGRCFEQK